MFFMLLVNVIPFVLLALFLSSVYFGGLYLTEYDANGSGESSKEGGVPGTRSKLQKWDTMRHQGNWTMPDY